MNSPEVKAAPRLLLAFLVLGGITALALAGMLNTSVATSWIEQRLLHAQGQLSVESSAWLHGPELPRGMLQAGIFLLGAAVGVWRFHDRLARFGRHLTSSDPSPAWMMPLIATMLVLLKFWPTLEQGYFRYDDFELMTVAKSRPLAESLWQLHGDHFLPLTRLLFHVAYPTFGVSAWPWNAWLLAAYAAVIALGTRVLAQLGRSNAAQAIFIVLLIWWSPVAEIMAGYYVLSTYLLIALLSLTAIHGYLHWQQHARPRDLASVALATAAAPLVDVSGWYGVGAVLVLLGSDLLRLEVRRDPLRLKRMLMVAGAIVAVSTLSLGATLYAYQVLHPNSFLGMAADGTTTPARILAEFCYLLGAGLVTSLGVPFVYARLPISLLGVVAGTLTVLCVLFVSLGWRRAPAPQRRHLAILLLILGGICLMICVGRPSFDSLPVRWAAKHIVPAFVCLCLLLAFSWDLVCRDRFPQVTLVALALFIGVQTAIGWLGMAVAFPPFGYPAELRDAGRRRAAVETLRENFLRPLAAQLEPGGAAPILDGAFIEARSPSLFQYNLSHYAPFLGEDFERIRWLRNPAMQSWHDHGVETVAALADAVSPRFRVALASQPALREWYTASVLLTPTTNPNVILPSQEIEMISDGTTELPVRTAVWKPETAPKLRVLLRRIEPTDQTPVRLEVWFAHDFSAGDWCGTLILPATSSRVSEIDLRQVYAFALSNQVSQLRLRFSQPGRYAIRLAEITP